MSSRKIAIQNKVRGRAFQTKLAEMSGGMNIGTLGGEDVSHIEFSYEAKTYKPNTVSNKGRNWVGEQMLYHVDKGKLDKYVVYKVEMLHGNIIMLRWYWWQQLLEDKINHLDLDNNTVSVFLHKFRGYTYMQQAESNCPDGKIPVVVVHTVGKRHERDIVLVLEDYWKSLLNKIIDKSV